MKINNKKIRIIYMSIIGFLLPLSVGFFLDINLILLSIFTPIFIILVARTKPENRFILLAFPAIIVPFFTTIHIAVGIGSPYQYEGVAGFGLLFYGVIASITSLAILCLFFCIRFHILANKNSTNENDKNRFFSKSTNYFIATILLFFVAMFLFNLVVQEEDPTSLPSIHDDFFDDYDY